MHLFEFVTDLLPGGRVGGWVGGWGWRQSRDNLCGLRLRCASCLSTVCFCCPVLIVERKAMTWKFSSHNFHWRRPEGGRTPEPTLRVGGPLSLPWKTAPWSQTSGYCNFAFAQGFKNCDPLFPIRTFHQKKRNVYTLLIRKQRKKFRCSCRCSWIVLKL